jgi:hypothetical protein
MRWLGERVAYELIAMLLKPMWVDKELFAPEGGGCNELPASAERWQQPLTRHRVLFDHFVGQHQQSNRRRVLTD